MSENINALNESGEYSKAFLIEFIRVLRQGEKIAQSMTETKNTSKDGVLLAEIVYKIIREYNSGQINNKTTLLQLLTEASNNTQVIEEKNDHFFYLNRIIKSLIMVVEKYDIDEETIDVLMRRLQELPC